VVCAVQDEIIHRLDSSLQLILYSDNVPVGPITPPKNLSAMTRPSFLPESRKHALGPDEPGLLGWERDVRRSGSSLGRRLMGRQDLDINARASKSVSTSKCWRFCNWDPLPRCVARVFWVYP